MPGRGEGVGALSDIHQPHGSVWGRSTHQEFESGGVRPKDPDDGRTAHEQEPV